MDDHVGFSEADLKRGITERARRFEEEVAELFRLLGYKATVDVLTDNRQYDVVIQKDDGFEVVHGRIECKDLKDPVGQDEIEKFGFKITTLRQDEPFLRASSSLAMASATTAPRWPRSFASIS